MVRGDPGAPGRRVGRVPRAAIRGVLVTVCLVAWASLLPPPPLDAQTVPPSQGGLIRSLGQPPVWKWYGGIAAGRSFRPPESSSLGILQLGILRDITNPVIGLLALAGEVYAGHAASAEYGVRALATSPLLGISIGVDGSVRHDEIRPLLRLRAPVRRGGFITRGGEIRVTWVPGRQLTAGLSVPLRQPQVGRTRPRETRVRLERPTAPIRAALPDDPRLRDDLERARGSARRLATLTVPFLDQGGSRDHAMEWLGRDMGLITDTLLRLAADSEASAVVAEAKRFHTALASAFGRAAGVSGRDPSGGSETDHRDEGPGSAAAAAARAIALEHVIFPYDRLLGLDRTVDSARQFAWAARGPFATWLVTESGIPAGRHDAVLGVFEAYLDLIEAARETVSDAWDDARLSWIPLQLALTPEQHDEQRELDDLVSRAVGAPFVSGNDVRYLSNVEWQEELLRGVQRAEDYHVLWIHDIDGRSERGGPDSLTLRYVVEGYLETLARRASEYDRTGHLPAYFIFIDQYYYERHDTRRWLALLEHPLDRDLDLGSGGRQMQSSLDRALASLREAVAGSRLLARHTAQYGREWLENRIKVHVNITNPADPSFWGNQLFPIFSLPDNLMRDHRKLAFYDITEEDPYRGAALFGGMGIGEHYSGPAWEDRGIAVKGPAALRAKEAVLQLLDSQGFDPERVPFPLRPRPRPPNYDEIVATASAREDADARVLQVHNHTGYLPKAINVAKATLYTLMPPGSVIIIPDSLWNSELWASMLLGSCLRGVRVLLISPARANAPGRDDFLPMARAHELMERLIVAREALAVPLARAGGALHLGLYDARLDVTDVRQRALAALDGLEEHPAIRALLPLSPEAQSLISDADGLLRRPGAESADGPIPQLHAKVQLFATREAWSVLGEPEVARLLRVGLGAGGLAPDRPLPPGAMTDIGTLGPAYDRFISELPPDERRRSAILLMVGSSNQDYRSILTDGEVSVLVSGRGAARAVPDFVSFLGLSTWIEDRDALDRRLPRYTGLHWWLSRLLRKSI